MIVRLARSVNEKPENQTYTVSDFTLTQGTTHNSAASFTCGASLLQWEYLWSPRIGQVRANAMWTLIWCFTPVEERKTNQKLSRDNWKCPLPPENQCHLTSERLKFHEAATTAAVQHFVFGRCGMGLSMCTDFDHAIACVVHFVLRTQSHLRMEKKWSHNSGKWYSFVKPNYLKV